MNQVIQDILARHQISLFELKQWAPFHYVLRTEEPVSHDLKVELQAELGLTVLIDFQLLRKPLQPALPGFPASSVSHPHHYNAGKIEVIEAIEDWNLGFNRGNAVKYLARAGKKDATKEIEDLEKAVWYVKREIEILKAENEGREPTRPNDMNPRVPVQALLAPLPPVAPPSAYSPLYQYNFIGHWNLINLTNDNGGSSQVMMFAPTDQEKAKLEFEDDAFGTIQVRLYPKGGVS